MMGAFIGDRIFVNGGTAARLYNRYLFPQLGLAATRLPSTSPANAAWTMDRLAEAWGKYLCDLLRRES